jgi:molybdopterin-guanine dinucleotide biosynthesis adapter protein
MRVLAVVGPSGSGKTTLLVALIRHFVTEGRSVGAIKHTHHALSAVNRGDTAAFIEAGAHPVILAGDREAIVFGVGRVEFDSPADLLSHFDTDLVLVEGFKEFDGWPRIEAMSFRDALTHLEQIWRTGGGTGRIR